MIPKASIHKHMFDNYSLIIRTMKNVYVHCTWTCIWQRMRRGSRGYCRICLQHSLLELHVSLIIIMATCNHPKTTNSITQYARIFNTPSLNSHVQVRGSLHTSQISHLLLYPPLWLLVTGLSSQLFAIISFTTCFNISSDQ